MADDVIRIKVGMNMRAIANSDQEDTVEIPRAEWDALSQDEQEARLNEEAEAFLANEVDAWAYVVNDEA